MFLNSFLSKLYLSLKNFSNMPNDKIKINICLGSSCFARRNKHLVKEINDYLQQEHLTDFVDFKGTRCFGECKDGPFCKIDDTLKTFHSLQEVIEYLQTHYPQIKNK